MTHKRRKKTSTAPQPAEETETARQGHAPAPVDVVDGMPDHAKKTSRWALPLVLIIFAVWVSILVYFLLAGRIIEGA